MKSKNNHTVSVILSAAKNLVNTQRMSSGSFTPFGMTKSTLHAVLCTLCSVLCFASCSEENLVDTPHTPNELRTLSVDINLPQGKPAFGGENTEATRTAGPELVAEISLGDSIKARNSETPSTTPPSITTGAWANGDELILHIAVSDATITYTEGKLTLKYYEAASTPQPNGEGEAGSQTTAKATGWYLVKAHSYTKYGAEFEPYTEALPLVVADEDASATEVQIDIAEPLLIRVDETAMGATAQVTYVYAPDMQLTGGAKLEQSDATTITAPEKFTYANGAWSALARVRVHTGAAGDVVTLTSSAFDTAWDVEPTTTDGIRIYTATTNKDGNAYFHGISNDLDGSEGKDLKIELTHMRVAVESPESPASRTVALEGDNTLLITLAEPLTLLEASNLVSFKLEESKPYKLLVNAKRTIAKQENLTYIAGNASDKLVAAQIQAGLALTGDAAIDRFVVTGAIGDGLAAGIGTNAIKLEFADATELPEGALSGCSGLQKIIFRNQLTSVGTNALTNVPTTCALVLAAGQGDVTAANNTLQWQGREWASIQEGGVNYKPLANYLCNTVGEGTGVYYEYTAPDGKKYAVIDGNTPAENVENLKNQIVAASSADGLEGFWVVNGLQAYSGGTASTVVGEAIRRYTGNETISILQLPVTALPENAFSGCTKLAALPWEDITSIGANAFSGCTGLTGTITIKQGANVDANAFTGATVSNCDLVLPAGQVTGITISNGKLMWAGAEWASITLLDGPNGTAGTKYYIDNGMPTVEVDGTCGITGANPAGEDIHVSAMMSKIQVVADAAATTNVSAKVIVKNGLAAYTKENATEDDIYAGTVVGEAIRQLTPTSAEEPRSAETVNYNGRITLTLDNATKLPELAFIYCEALQSVSAPKATTIGENAFALCSALTSVSLPEATNIGKQAFALSGLIGGLSLPAATTIGEKAFLNCTALTSVSLPNATTIDDAAFVGTRLTGELSLPAATTIGTSAFQSCTGLTSVSLPNATTIGASAFQNCTSLMSVSLPKATTIRGTAFQGCTVLKTVLFGTVVTGLGDYAFDGVNTTGCDLTLAAGQQDADDVTLRVTASNSQLMWAGKQWQSITVGGVKYAAVGGELYAVIDGSVTDVNTVMAQIQAVPANTKILVTNGLAAYTKENPTQTDIYAGTVVGEAIRLLTSQAMPTNTSEEDYTGSISLVLDDGITEIPYIAFRGCKELRSVVANGVTTIGIGAFYECTGIKELTFGQKFDEVGMDAFGLAPRENGYCWSNKCVLTLKSGQLLLTLLDSSSYKYTSQGYEQVQEGDDKPWCDTAWKEIKLE